MDGSGLPEVKSTCPYCGVGCGVILRPDGAGGVSVRGDEEHPANFGRLCSKGSALGQTVGLEDRLLAPQVDGRESDWDAALSHVADRFSQTIAEHGPDSVAFYVSGQLLSEDYYVANKLMKGFIGSANIDTNSRLCMASSVAGHKRAFGTDTVPGTFEDVEQADLVVLVGSNLAWCHPVLYQRMLAAKKARPDMRVVVVDPRRTASCDVADLHLKLKSGSDVALFNGLLNQIEDRGAVNANYLQHVDGADAAFQAARDSQLDETGVSQDDIDTFYDWWVGTEKVVTIYSQGVNQSSSGSDKVNAIINCHLATGRIGKPGMGPLSVTGQPNAMGGREVGGLANMLANHLDLENAAHRHTVGTFWNTDVLPDRPGLKAVDMFQAVGDGRIKALWVIHTNPAVSMPDADAVAKAIAGCPFTVVSDITLKTDTARLADVVLPASAWAEKDGTVTNSDRVISRQRAVLPAPGQARADWDILADVGRRMGWKDAFDYESPCDIFREYAALSAQTAVHQRDFNISAFQDISEAAYAVLSPVRWPVSKERRGGRFFAEGQFFTPNGKGQMLALRMKPPAAKTEPRFPLRLNTGRIRDQWHTMTRTAKSPRLSAHLAEPFLDIHPQDAEGLGLSSAALVSVRSPHGQAILRARVTPDVRPGEVFAPIHWTGETAPSALIDAVVAPVVDPVSGQPESKASVVAVAPFKAAWYGFAVSHGPIYPSCDYWARAKTNTGWRAELADAKMPDDWEDYVCGLFGVSDAQIQSVQDPVSGIFRFAIFQNDILVAAFFASRTPVAVMRDYLVGLPGTTAAQVLSGRAPADQPDPGAMLCSCFSVGINTILAAIEKRGLTSVDQIGEAIQAGTNCGSCRPELEVLLKRATIKEAAE